MKHPRNRAERIANKQTKRAKRTKYATVSRHNHETPASCSCWMCGNPRKYADSAYNALTLQERRHWIAVLESQLGMGDMPEPMTSVQEVSYAS